MILRSFGLPPNAIFEHYVNVTGRGTRREVDEIMLRKPNELDNRELTFNELTVKYSIMCVIV